MTKDKRSRAQRLRAKLVESLGLRDAYRRDHSPTGVRRRRIVWNAQTGSYEILPEPKRIVKRQLAPDDKRLENLRKEPRTDD